MYKFSEKTPQPLDQCSDETLCQLVAGGSREAEEALVTRYNRLVRTCARPFFLVGGCDGTRPSRRYYTEFARLTPPDTILLTLACGKFRLNDLPLGTVPGTGLPRILDVGQCNDAYSAIRIALALADAFGCGVNDLPLSLVLCWFEQKAVCILIALLALGIRNIRLGPTLPPFLSPGVVRTLQERYGLKPIATPEADLQAILGG